ncbi:MAG: dihydroorotate dehydrogenase electron transfer subunit [Acidobacteriota bacterium]|jgi:dihydroorotate dehydrogenase electron transfer subunit
MALKTFQVTENRVQGSYAAITAEGPVSPALPGQFYMLRGDWGADPLLSRPVSILAQDVSSRQIRFLIKVFGEGSRRLASLKPGELLYGTGPFGNTFPVDFLSPEDRVLLVGGGVGMPPIVYLAESTKAMGVSPVVLQGGRTEKDLVLLEELAGLKIDPVLATEDGSRGRKGRVTVLLEEALKDAPRVVYACGPEGMLQAVADVCRGRVACYLSLEAYMACGYGVCLGCVVSVRQEEGGRYRRVCKEGPVFSAEDLTWR